MRSALRLREMCSRNGGLFIKVGQHLGSLEYILPRVYVETFKVFHSEAPQTSLSRLKAVVEEEFGRPGWFIHLYVSIVLFWGREGGQDYPGLGCHGTHPSNAC